MQSKSRLIEKLGIVLPIITTGFFAIFNQKYVVAQLTPDNTLGTENSLVTTQQLRDLIQGGAIRGKAIFHSFESFNVGDRNVFFDLQNADVLNIFTRVTGSNSSNILGTLGILKDALNSNDLGDANLFLLNPNGITFGANANLQLNGSFVATTADSLGFDNFTFSASVQEVPPPLLTVNLPNFLTVLNNPGNIAVNQGNLTVNQEQNLALVGGNINISGSGNIENLQGTLTAFGGRIELGGLTTAGTISLNPDFSLVFPDDAPRGDVSLTDAATLSVVSNANDLNGGSVGINGQNISLTGDSAILAGIGVGFGGEAVTAGDINLNATGGITLSESSDTVLEPGDLTTGRGVQNRLNQRAQGMTGDINITSSFLNISNGSSINATNLGVGQGGNITIDTTESISITDNGTSVRSGILTGILFNAEGSSGNITISTDLLSLANGGYITTTTFGAGNSGTITVNADTIQAYGFRDGNTNLSSGVYAQLLSFPARARAEGNAGNINITANYLNLTDFAQINADTGAVGNADSPIGNGGNINISTSIFELTDNGKVQASNTAIGNGGTITISSDFLTLNDSSAIEVSSSDSGNAGNININAAQISLDNQSILRGNVDEGSQGNINLTSQLLQLRNGSNITTNATGISTGGNINLNTSNLIALEGSNITANAVQGQGGNIVITTQGIFLSLDSQITASSQFGVDGVVETNTSGTESKLAINQLPVDITDASQQIANGCEWVAADNDFANSFTVTGRGGVPTNTMYTLMDEQMWVSMDNLLENQSSSITYESPPRQERIVEANAMIINEKGNVEFVAIIPITNSPDLHQKSCGVSTDSY